MSAPPFWVLQDCAQLEGIECADIRTVRETASIHEEIQQDVFPLLDERINDMNGLSHLAVVALHVVVFVEHPQRVHEVIRFCEKLLEVSEHTDAATSDKPVPGRRRR